MSTSPVVAPPTPATDDPVRRRRPLGRRVHRQGAVRQIGGPGEAEAAGRKPADRAQPGTKRHGLTEARGIPVAVVVTGANRHDMRKPADLLDATVVVPAPAAPPQLVLDQGYDNFIVYRKVRLARSRSG